MICPRCGHGYVCPCGADGCKKRANGRQRWVSLGDDLEACGHCGLTAHLDQWLDEEYQQLANGRNEWPQQYPKRVDDYLARPGRHRAGEQGSAG
jgi:hypothetical protein